jgi:bud emergence protein 1
VRTSQAGPQTPQTPLFSPVRPDAVPNKTPVFYAVVLHDFAAERADELDANRGDLITVVAQSNREWFVAKPIGRIGRPGLIPVSFVEIHDPSTGQAIADVDGLMDRGELPKVEDWKRAMLNYKQNSIALGVIDAPVRAVPTATYTQPTEINSPPQAGSSRDDSPEPLPDGILLTADVISFHYEMEQYWFRIDAIYQPYSRPGQTNLPPSKQLILFRVYDDFYDFQVALLETFPREAGRQPPEPRTLPYMPGPAQNVDDALTATRRSELDDYVHSLCNLGKTGSRYILEHVVVRKFLSLKPGDVENDGEPRTQEIDAIFKSETQNDIYDIDDYGIDEQMERMKVRDDRRSDGSDYEDEGYAPSLQHKAHDRDKNPYQGSNAHLRLNQLAQNHQRAGSATSLNKLSSYSSKSRSNSPQYRERHGSPQPVRNGEYSNGQSRRNDDGYHHESRPSESTRSSQVISSRSRSHSTATTTNLNTPPISSANSQTAFVKIKIFDRVADDLIAIRVHPRVTHVELMDKVQTRLGGDVGNLRYRDSLTNTYVGLDSDEELRAWMEGTDKHVLYAD